MNANHLSPHQHTPHLLFVTWDVSDLGSSDTFALVCCSIGNGLGLGLASIDKVTVVGRIYALLLVIAGKELRLYDKLYEVSKSINITLIRSFQFEKNPLGRVLKLVVLSIYLFAFLVGEVKYDYRV
jgi:hypothetical protein